MKAKFALLAIAVLCGAAHSQSVAITPKKVSYLRTLKDVPDYKRTFVVRYPVLSGLERSKRRKIVSNLDYWRAFSWSGNTFSLKSEIEKEAWVDSLDYEVKYNAKNILDVWLTMEGSGAYPDSSTRHVVIDLRSGKKLELGDLFRRDRFPALRDAIRRSMKRSEAALSQEEKEELTSEREIDIYRKYHPGPDRIQLRDFYGFTVNENGVTFLFDYGYAHVVQALEPPGEFHLTYAELTRFIRRDGLLWQFIH